MANTAQGGRERPSVMHSKSSWPWEVADMRGSAGDTPPPNTPRRSHAHGTYIAHGSMEHASAAPEVHSIAWSHVSRRASGSTAGRHKGGGYATVRSPALPGGGPCVLRPRSPQILPCVPSSPCGLLLRLLRGERVEEVGNLQRNLSQEGTTEAHARGGKPRGAQGTSG
jgi:hypothetical protein